MVTVLRPLSTSELLDRTFHLYKNNFLVFVGIAAIPQIFVLVLQLTFRFKPDPTHMGAMMAEAGGLWIIVIIAALIAHAATTVAVSDLHLDKPAGIQAAFSVARSSILRVICVALVVIFVPMLIALPIGLIVGIALGAVMAGRVAGRSSNVFMIGMGALVAPLIILVVGLRWWLMWS